jgi:dihydropteroate synthase
MKPFSLNIKGKLLTYNTPAVMGILNVTPDSFYADSHAFQREDAVRKVRQMIAEGADIIDLGGYSSRPGADEVSVAEECRRVKMGMEVIREVSADIPVSVDTFRGEVAHAALTEWRADIINDISMGAIDPEMLPTVKQLKAPYILMHMRGTPATMQQLTDYPNGVAADVIAELSAPLHELREAGVADIIIDPGFGFSKTLEQNYALMRELPRIEAMLGCPLLVGISRKSMITKLCGINAADALPGTIALNTAAMMAGAAIVRVHDVAAAVQARAVTMALTAGK